MVRIFSNFAYKVRCFERLMSYYNEFAESASALHELKSASSRTKRHWKFWSFGDRAYRYIYLSNEQTWCTKFLFYNKFISCFYMFRGHLLIIRRSKLHYIASGIITPVGDLPVHRLRNGAVTYRCDDNRGCLMQFWPPHDSTFAINMKRYEINLL